MLNKKPNQPNPYECLDCKVDTWDIGEYYMVHDEVWKQINPDDRGMLCVKCAEKRLGRQLTANDFQFNIPCNRFYDMQSDLLKERMNNDLS